MATFGQPTDRNTAKATTAVLKYEPVVYDSPSEGPRLVRVHLEETFTGDIEALGVAEVIQAVRPDRSATYVTIERVTGTLAGRTGVFLLQVSGIIEGGQIKGDWFVVPGSGVGELAGLRGEGGFQGDVGDGAPVHLDYWFE